MRMRTLFGCSCLAMLLAAYGKASAEVPARPVPVPDSAYLVKEVVYNELHDHDAHGYWRYWVERHAGRETQIEAQVETHDGPIKQLQTSNGHPLGAVEREQEEQRLRRLLNSRDEQEQHRKAYAEDEQRIGRILALLPDAFIYEPAQVEAGPQGACYHLKFHPNPDYPAHSIEARIFHAMAGDLWVSVQSKRLVRLDGKLQENVDFGYGILGRLYKDGWFRLERTHVGGGADAAHGDWKTQRLEVHMQGRAMLFKTIAKETSEVRDGFEAVPNGLSLEQAAALVRQPVSSVSGTRDVALVSAR